MDNDILMNALSAQIEISIALIGMVRKPFVEPIVLAERWGITQEKVQKTVKAKSQRGIRTKLHSSLSRQFTTNDNNLCYHCLKHSAFSDMMFASKVFSRGNRCAQVYVTDFGWA